jgi:hypothetical protein
VDHEISVQDIARSSGRACARSAETDLSGKRGSDHTRSSVAGSHTHVGVEPCRVGASEAGAVSEEAVVAPTAGRISGAEEAVLGPAPVGAVDEETIKKYIESQKWDEEDQGFKITAPTEP